MQEGDEVDADYYLQIYQSEYNRVYNEIPMETWEPDKEKPKVSDARPVQLEDNAVETKDNDNPTIYTEPIPLDGIPEELTKLMTEVCPLLRGCDAKYPAKFFKEVVGLCDHGTLLENVLKETKIATKMVLGS